MLFLLASSMTAQQCKLLNNNTPAKELLSFLQASKDLPKDQQDRECITFAIERLQGKPSQEAISILIEYLDFERPMSDAERQGFMLHGPATFPGSSYPAPGALITFGKDALPALLSRIAVSSSKATDRNATYAVMQIFRDDPLQGIETLNRRAADLAPSQGADKLKTAAHDAVQWCTEAHRKQCQAAAGMVTKQNSVQ
jgi:hypothetical protein